MKTLITGANGQVAFELHANTARQSKDVIALSKEQLNITNWDHVSQVIQSIQPDVVINAAAYTQVEKAEDDIETAFAVNREGAKNLAIACEKNHCPLIHLSTDYVFDGEQKTPYLETDPVSPINVYGKSKWEGEKAIRQHHEKHLIVRVSGVFGAHGQNFVKTILRLSRERKMLQVVNDQITCPTPAKEIAKMLWQLCEKLSDNTAWGVYHFCSQPAVSWYEFANCFVQNVEPILSKDYPTRAKRPKNAVLNCQKIKQVFDIQQPDWQKGLDDVLFQMPGFTHKT